MEKVLVYLGKINRFGLLSFFIALARCGPGLFGDIGMHVFLRALLLSLA
jgi:hypothetical protein